MYGGLAACIVMGHPAAVAASPGGSVRLHAGVSPRVTAGRGPGRDLRRQGAWIKAGALILFCGVIVGSVDNLLRPRLVGKDTEMHDLLILFSTLGGIAMFGILGIIIGPIIAALFVTIWDIYGVVFKDALPKVGP